MVGAVSLALRDGNASRLEEEGARLSALLEMARAEARAAGTPVRWQPTVLADVPRGAKVPATSAELRLGRAAILARADAYKLEDGKLVACLTAAPVAHKAGAK